ncbi:MAG: hypothetical protein P1U89_02425 [Verrucomicrobiales bacterium]|nr:hypothetical protein [Verrucomicrobiales bacterium]
MKLLSTTLLSASLLWCGLFCQAEDPAELISGQGEWRFRYREDLSTLPAGAEAHIKKAHGGFAVDRKGDGDVYFHLDGYGLIHLSPDLSQANKIEGDSDLAAGNGHNTSFGYDKEGTPYLVIPDNKRGIVLFTDTSGRILHRLGRPGVMDWFMGMKYAPTDTLVLDGKVLVADGYGSRHIFPVEPFGDYLKGVYGGKSTFSTSHGLDLNPVTKQVAIADRETFQIRYFTQDGKEVTKDRKPVTTQLPKGARPCDIDYMPDGTAVVGCLKGAGWTPGEIYILDPAGEVLSVIKPKLELGLDHGNTNVEHVHNASWTKVGDKFFLLVYAWNPGGFAVLERVEG